jgi:hypothetical protein
VFRLSQRMELAGTGLVLVGLTSACEPELVVGKVSVDASPTCRSSNSEGGSPGVVEIGWTTSFENGFCDYQPPLGFCYVNGTASFSIAENPVHNGTSSAAFSVNTSLGTAQTRCFLDGTLPRDAVYGAWFYIPTLAQNTGNWNLMYIQGTVPPTPGLWDVSLANSDDGSLHLYLFSHLGPAIPELDPPLTVPIGSWFHVAFRLLRAPDATGAVALYQDGVLVQEATGIVTDAYDLHHWYVGNLASSLTPPDSTIYVDDVTVTAAP